MEYLDIYMKRLNRYGLNYQERVLSERREAFNSHLLKSVYRIDFDYNGETHPATFERYKQDHTEIFRYLFTKYDLAIPGGTILMLPDPIGIVEYESSPDTKIYPEYAGSSPNSNSSLRPWMVYFLEDTGAKGYNRYILLKMTHFLKWKDRNKIDRTSYAYMYGQEDNMLIDELKSRSRSQTVYSEELKASFFVMPATEHLRKDDYFIIDKDINHKVLEEYYRVTGYDIQSQDGVEYVTVDPTYEYSKDFYTEIEKPEITRELGESEEHFKERQKENDSEYFWLDMEAKSEEE